MPLSYFGDFDCDSTANNSQCSQRSLHGAAKHCKSSANGDCTEAALRIDSQWSRQSVREALANNSSATTIKARQ